MKISPISSNTKIKSPNKRAAVRGAAITAGVMTVSEGISWLVSPKSMLNMVKENGGKLRYAKNTAVIIGMCSILGAVLNTVFFSIAKKVNSNKQPKAVN